MNQDPARLIMFIALFVGGAVSLIILIILLIAILGGGRA
jgi:hypothetical protein